MSCDSPKFMKLYSLYQAAFLFAKGAELAGVEMDQGQVSFSFINSPECEIWANEFKNGPEALIDARLYMNALQVLSRQRQELLMRIHAGKS